MTLDPSALGGPEGALLLALFATLALGAISLVLRRELPLPCWFVLPGLQGLGMSVHAYAELLPRPGDGLLTAWTRCAAAAVCVAVLLGVGVLHGMVLLHPLRLVGTRPEWRRTLLPATWLGAGSLVTAWIAQRQGGREELIMLPTAILLLGIVPVLLRAVPGAPSARIAAMYGACCTAGAYALVCLQWAELSQVLRFGLDERLVAWAGLQARACALMGLGVAAMGVDRQWRAALPAGAWTVAVLSPCVLLDLALRQRLDEILPEDLRHLDIDVPVARDLSGAWAYGMLYLPTSRCRSKFIEGEWVDLTPERSFCEERLLYASADLSLRELRSRMRDWERIYLLVRGPGGPTAAASYRMLRLERSYGPRIGGGLRRMRSEDLDLLWLPLDSDAHEVLEGMQHLRPTISLSVDWTVADLVSVCLSARGNTPACRVAHP